jgi:tetratricopeptide (TPR) repeat protein
MKKYTLFIIVLVSLFLIFASSAAQNGYDLFQKALAKERGEGNLEEAISLYQKVVAETKDESLAAKAQLRIGICYEKLGLKEAQKAFQKVIDNYPSQTETVKVAKEKLSILVKARTVLKKGDQEFRIRKVWDYARMGGRGNMGRPSPDGRYLLYWDMYSPNVCALEFATKKKHLITKEKVWSASREPSSKKPIEFHWGGSIWSPDTKKVAYSWLKFKNVFALKDAWDEE